MTDNAAANTVAYLESLGLGEAGIAKLKRLAQKKGITLEALMTNDFPGWRAPQAANERRIDPIQNSLEPTDDT
jgi:hypothetical protein